MKNNKENNSSEQSLQNKTDKITEITSAQRDGIRYDYNDSSDFQDDEMH
jgi:hypothetical protein